MRGNFQFLVEKLVAICLYHCQDMEIMRGLPTF